MECEYCKKSLKTKSSLNNHKKSAKYCLKIQGCEKNKDFICDSCGTGFTLKSTLIKHIKICGANTSHVKAIKNELVIYKHKVEILEQRVLDLENDKKTLHESYTDLANTLAKRSTTTTNNTVNNLNLAVFNKTQADIKRIVDEKYDKEYLMEGQKGVARFTNSHVLNTTSDDQTPMYLITDKTRCNGKYRVSENEVVTDNGMMGLTNKIHPSIKKKAVFIAAEGDAMNDEELFKNFQEVFEMNDDNTIFRKEMIRILDNVI